MSDTRMPGEEGAVGRAAGVLMAGYRLSFNAAVTSMALSAQLLEVGIVDVAMFVEWQGELPTS